MTYTEALKKIQSKKARENFLMIRLSYDSKLVLPYKDGLNLISTLAQAEQLKDEYGKRKRIVNFEPDSVHIQVLSATEYDQIKIAALLDVDIEEVKKYDLETA